MTTKEVCLACNGTGVAIKQDNFAPPFDFERWRETVTEVEIDRANRNHRQPRRNHNREQVRYNIALGKSIGTYSA